MWDNIKQSNIYIIEIPEWREKELGRKKNLKKKNVMAKFGKSSRIRADPKQNKYKENHTSNLIVKLLETENRKSWKQQDKNDTWHRIMKIQLYEILQTSHQKERLENNVMISLKLWK